MFGDEYTGSLKLHLLSDDIVDGFFDGFNNLVYNEYDNAYYLGNSHNPYFMLIKAKDTSITSCEINIMTSVIYDGAFSGCKNLTSITLPNSLTSLGDSVFSGSSLESIIISSSVTKISETAFNGCSSLSNIRVHIDNPAYKDINGNHYRRRNISKICCGQNKHKLYYSGWSDSRW